MLRLVFVCTNTGKQILSRAFCNQKAIFLPRRQAGKKDKGHRPMDESLEAIGLPSTVCSQIIVIMNHMHECTGMYLHVIKQGPVSWVISKEKKINGTPMRCILLVSSEMPDFLSTNLVEALLEEFNNIYRGLNTRVADASEAATFASTVEIGISTAIQRMMFDGLKNPITDIRVVRTPNGGQPMLLSPLASSKTFGTKTFRLNNNNNIINLNNGPSAPSLMSLYTSANRLLHIAFPESGLGTKIRLRLMSDVDSKSMVVSSMKFLEGPVLLSTTLDMGNDGHENSTKKLRKLKKPATSIMNLESAIETALECLSELSQVSLSTRVW